MTSASRAKRRCAGVKRRIVGEELLSLPAVSERARLVGPAGVSCAGLG